MQSKIRSDKPAISPQTLYSTQEDLLNNTEFKPDMHTPFSEESRGFSGPFPKSQTKGQPGIRERKRPSSTAWQLILVIGDMILLAALFWLLLFIFPLPQASKSLSNIWNVKLIWVCLALASWSIANSVTHSQNLSFASSRFKSPCSILFALMLMFVLWLVFSNFLLGIRFFTAARLELFFLALAVPAFTTWRILLAQTINLPSFRPRAVIVGVNSSGEAIAHELQGAKHHGVNLLGYIGESSQERFLEGKVPILGGKSELHYMIHKGLIDIIIMALDYKADLELFKEVTETAQYSVAVVPMAVFYESTTGKIPVEHVGDQWYLALHSERILTPLYLFWRKVLDLICGFCGLLALGIVMPIIALFIHLDSPGPIFYSQERVGLRGKPFRIYKFRSMHIDAEARGQAVWATKYDPRITKIGRLLRATHLDELPQLFNVLQGDMSLIGPRPERAEFVAELEKIIPFYRYRLTVKPGLTGWAQVKYRYGRTDNDALIKLQYDLYYIKRQSFMLDLFIILKTVFEVLSLRGS